MKHQTLDQLQAIAEVHSQPTHPPMTRSQRLERWVELLEARPQRLLRALAGTEHQRATIRDEMRCEGSPIAIAFNDPLLRAEGLNDDTYGEAIRFFNLTDRQLHGIVCDCYVGATMTASRAARRVRAAMGANRGIFARLRDALFL